MKNKVFLGGTWANSIWRDELIPMLGVDYFNPVVEDWTADCQAIEQTEKSFDCNIHLYVITSAMKGVFSIAEVIESVHMHGKHTILHVDPTGFDVGELKSLQAVVDMVNKHGGVGYIDCKLERVARIINYCFGG